MGSRFPWGVVIYSFVIPPSLSRVWYRPIPLCQFQVAPSPPPWGSELWRERATRAKPQTNAVDLTRQPGSTNSHGSIRVICEWIYNRAGSRGENKTFLARTCKNTVHFFKVALGSDGTSPRLGLLLCGLSVLREQLTI